MSRGEFVDIGIFDTYADVDVGVSSPNGRVLELPDFKQIPEPYPSWFAGILEEDRTEDRSSKAWRIVIRSAELGYPYGIARSMLHECPEFLDKYSGRIDEQTAILFGKAQARHPHTGEDCWDTKEPTQYCLKVMEYDEPGYCYKYIDLKLATLVVEKPEASELDEFLAQDEPEYDWLIPGLLEREERLILTGGEGNGKTTLERQIGIQCASGIHPVTHEPMEPIRVLMVDLENPRRLVRRKMRQLRQIANHSYVPGNFTIISKPEGLDLGTKDDVHWLSEEVSKAMPDLLIIGPLYKMTDMDLSDNVASKKISSVLDQIRIHYHCSMIIEAHLRHAAPNESRPIRPYGASLWLRWPEFGLHLSSTGGIKHFRNPRDERPWPESFVRGNPANGDWPWMIGGSGEAVSSVADALRRLANAEIILLEIVGLNPGIKTGDLTEKLKDRTGISANNDLSQIIKGAVDEGKILRRKMRNSLLHYLPGTVE
jgi:AAA domain